MDSISASLFHVIDLLEREEVPYALIGGVAVTILSQERFTKDIDLTVLLREDQAKQFEALFRNDASYQVEVVSFISSESIPDFMRVFWQGIPIDLLVANTDFQKELIARAVSYKIEGRPVCVATPEDMIILKLLADRPRDREDINALLQAYPALDWSYIEKWCQVWEIKDRLSQIR